MIAAVPSILFISIWCFQSLVFQLFLQMKELTCGCLNLHLLMTHAAKNIFLFGIYHLFSLIRYWCLMHDPFSVIRYWCVMHDPLEFPVNWYIHVLVVGFLFYLNFTLHFIHSSSPNPSPPPTSLPTHSPFTPSSGLGLPDGVNKVLPH